MVRSFGLGIPGTRNVYNFVSIIFNAHSNVNITSSRNSEPKRTHHNNLKNRRNAYISRTLYVKSAESWIKLYKTARIVALHILLNKIRTSYPSQVSLCPTTIVQLTTELP